MDIQLKRGILEICVLKALEKQDSYGYQIIKDLNAELKKKNPGALVVSGRVNRFWYEEACLQRGNGNGNI